MRKFPCVFMRGGTSKGCMFLESDLPARDQWDDIFVQAMGSPDPKQIDGMGGCVSSNNKIVVVRKSDRPGIDVDYIVGQSIVGQSKIDYKSNCGNMTAATAPYAVEMGLVENLTEPTTVVHLFNLNTNKTIDVEVPIKDGQFNNEGTCSIAGVDGTAGELKVNFLDPAGAKTGRLFPTGNAKEMLDLGELGTIEATILDVSNPMVLVRAADLGITGTQLPAEVDADKALAAKLGISEPAVSQQLQVLKDCGLVTGERLDYQMHYRVDRTRLEQAVRAVAPLLSACQVPQSRLENCACEFAGTCSRRKAGKKA